MQVSGRDEASPHGWILPFTAFPKHPTPFPSSATPRCPLSQDHPLFLPTFLLLLLLLG